MLPLSIPRRFATPLAAAISLFHVADADADDYHAAMLPPLP